jgi:hypothetical protein
MIGSVIGSVRHNFKIVAPTLIITGYLVLALVGMVLFFQFRTRDTFSPAAAARLGEDLVPIIAAFFAAGVLDAEMKRGAHELLRSKFRPLWHTVGLRLGVAVGLALGVGALLLAALHFGIRRVPVGMILLATAPPSLCLAAVSLWTRIRFGNAFIGYVVALAVWVSNTMAAELNRNLGISLNPLLTFTAYTDRLQAMAAGALATTPYVDWWWINKLALLAVAAGVFFSITRRVDRLTEGD